MSSSSSDCVVQTGKLVVLVAETGHIHELDCEECTLVEAVQRNLESVTRVPFNDQLLLCLGMKLELQRSLSAYKLPSNDREVFLFNKARMRSNTPPPTIEQVPIIDIHDPPFPSSNDNPHPLDEATDPALKALPSYERQFMYHFQYGDAIYSRTIAKFDICERLLREQKVQERALEIAWGNLDHFYKMILQTYMDFMKCYSQQHRSHNSLLENFGRDIEKLRSIKLLPALQMANRRCLLDFVKEKNLWKMMEDCNSSHRQFENKVSEFKQEFGELKHNVERLFANKASFLTKELDLTMKDHQRFINEQKSIMQALSKDVNTVKKLVDDCLSSQLSSSLRPHDAVSALGPMYDSHDSNYIPNMQACDRAISSFLDFCQDKKNEMNSFVHSYMQKIAYIQYTIKDVRYKFSVFQEALKCQNDQFDPLKVVHGIGPAYRACLAEVVRRKAAMKLYTGMAGKLAEKLATKRECEVKRREEFLKVHSRYIPRDVLASMGLYDTPNQCDINITPFDTNLLDIDLSDLDRYAPESLLGLASKREKHGTPKSSLSMSNDGSHSAEVEGSTMPLSEKYDSEELLEVSDLVEIAGTSKMEVENAKLKAELASKIALICSISPDFDHESLDDSKIDIILKNAAEKTSEALNQKDEYIKHLKTTLKMKQIQCESYERRIQELEQRLSDQYLQGPKPSFDEEISNFVISTVQSENNRPEVLGVEEAHMPHTMENVSCASSSSKSGLHSKQDKVREGLDDNMTDSSTLSPHLDSSMMDPRRDEAHLCEKDKKETLFSDGDMALTTSSMALSMSQPVGDLCDKAVQPCLDAKASIDLLELQSALAEKSNQLADAETKLQMLTEEIFNLEKEMEISRKLLDESQMNCAHLENCLHEARKEAQTHLCAADRRASEYSALRASAIKMHSLFERLRSCVSSSGVVAFADSLRALAQSLANSSNGNDDDSTGEFRECIRVLADKVSLLSRHRAELCDRYSKAEAEIELLKKEVEDKKESVNTLYVKHQLEKQANKERISFGRLEVHEIAAFVLNSAGHYEAINRNCPYYYLSAESVALFAAHLPSQPSYIVGQVVHIERQTVKSTTLDGAENVRDPVDLLISDNTGTSGSPYGLPLGCEYFVVTVAMLPDTTIHLSPTS